MKGMLMKQLTNEELLHVNAGAINTWVAVAAGIFVFAVGVIDGYIRPLKCNK